MLELKVKLSSYIAQYQILTIAQSAIHSTPHVQSNTS